MPGQLAVERGAEAARILGAEAEVLVEAEHRDVLLGSEPSAAWSRRAAYRPRGVWPVGSSTRARGRARIRLATSSAAVSPTWRASSRTSSDGDAMRAVSRSRPLAGNHGHAVGGSLTRSGARGGCGEGLGDGRFRACLPPSRSPHSTRPSSSSRRPTSRRTCTSEGCWSSIPLPAAAHPRSRSCAATSSGASTRSRAIASGSRAAPPAACTGRRGCPTSASTSPRTSPAPPCPSQAASASCSLGRPTSGRTASTARGRCGASSCSRASPAGAGRWSPRPTTASWTASARSTRAPCCSTPSRTRPRKPPGAAGAPAFEPQRPEPLRRLAGLPMAATEATVGDAVRHPRRAAEALDSARALVELLMRDELVAAPKTSLNVPLSEHRRLAVTEVPLEEIKAIKRAPGRHGQRRHPLARHRRAARAARGRAARTRPPRACARWCRSTSVQRGRAPRARQPHHLAVRPSSGRGRRAERPLSDGCVRRP